MRRASRLAIVLAAMVLDPKSHVYQPDPASLSPSCRVANRI